MLGFLISCSKKQVKPETPPVDHNKIRDVISASSKKMRSCYEAALNRTPDLTGKVVIEWEIIKDGKVQAAKVKESDIKDKEMEKCLVTMVEGLKFAPPPKDQIELVRFPFVFKTNIKNK